MEKLSWKEKDKEEQKQKHEERGNEKQKEDPAYRRVICLRLWKHSWVAIDLNFGHLVALKMASKHLASSVVGGLETGMRASHLASPCFLALTARTGGENAEDIRRCSISEPSRCVCGGGYLSVVRRIDWPIGCLIGSLIGYWLVDWLDAQDGPVLFS